MGIWLIAVNLFACSGLHTCTAVTRIRYPYLGCHFAYSVRSTATRNREQVSLLFPYAYWPIAKCENTPVQQHTKKSSPLSHVLTSLGRNKWS